MASKPNPTGRILVIEDNVTTADTLSLFLRGAGHQVEQTGNGRDGLVRAASGDFDLVLLDLMLPDLDGLSICRALRDHETPGIPIVMLTARSADEDVVAGLESGADDYVTKPFSSKVLLARIRRCLERATGGDADDPCLRVGELELDPLTRRVRLRGQDVHLTKSELAILEVLMGQPGRVFTRDQLIDQALGRDFEGTDRTIDTHVWSLRRKLDEPRGEPRYLLSEPGVGYRLDDPRSP